MEAGGSCLRGRETAIQESQQPSSRALLDVRDLSVCYAGAVRALHGVSLSIPERSVVAVLGSHGAGKSTLLRAISCTLGLQGGTVDGGEIEFAGRNLRGVDPGSVVRAGIVQVPEGRRIFGDLTVEEDLRAGALAVRAQSDRSGGRSTRPPARAPSATGAPARGRAPACSSSFPASRSGARSAACS